MHDRSSPTYRSLLISALILATAGWTGLLLLVMSTLPTVGPRWLFFFLFTLASTGTSLPFIWMLHRRLRPDSFASPAVLLRQSLMLTAYFELCLWLQVNRSLTLSLAMLLGMGLLAMEWLLGVLERSTGRAGR
ncbi:MAG TPA: hypothetical protein ENL35_01070 [Chloroflexi bacterium]|nr:hypothetical protein [Chloroflexota bacterium]